MPEINQTYQIPTITPEQLYGEALLVLQKLQGQNFEEEIFPHSPFDKETTCLVSSIWGWGGMKLTVHVMTTETGATLKFRGYIAQLGVSPLTKLMDQFLELLQKQIQEKYQLTFTYEKLSRFIPKFSLDYNDTDTKVIGFLVLTFFASLIGSLLGKLSVRFIFIPIGILIYLVVSKLLKPE